MKFKPFLRSIVPPPASSQAGLTLIECLVAIMVIGISMAAVAPALVLTVASRIQSQKADQALGLAQREIDQVRLLMERGEADIANLPLSTPIATDIRGVAAPSNFVPSTTYSEPVIHARTVDVTGNGRSDFAIQIFRDPGVIPTGGTNPLAFEMGVRVYDIRAEANLGSLETGQANLGPTDQEGSRLNRPLAALYTTVLQGEAQASLCTYASVLAEGASTGLTCD